MIRSLLLAALLFLAGAGTAQARDVGTCIPASLGISFGRFTGSEIETVGSIVLACRGEGRLNYRVALSTGAGTYDSRRMQHSADTLAYNLYTDSRHRTVWGDGSGSSQEVRGVVSLRRDIVQTEIVSVYALLPATEPPSVGTYVDTIVVTVTTDDGANESAFLVTASSSPACTISATNLVFPDYVGSQVDGQSQISVVCNPSLPWSVGLGPGDAPGATTTSRRMSGPGLASLAYSLYRDPARTQNWGNNLGVDTVAGVGTGTEQRLNVFGRIPPSSAPAVGGYRDRIVATVTF